MWTLLLACTPPEPTGTPYAVPDGAVVGLHDPDEVDVWPDDLHTVPDPTTATGVRVQLRPGARTMLDTLLPPTFDLVSALHDLDGFGVTADLYLRFSGPLDPATFPAAVHVVDLDDGAPVAVDVGWTDGGETAVLTPWFPLRPGGRYAALIDRGATDADGGRVWATPWLHDLLVTPAGLTAEPRVAAGLQRGLSLTGLVAEDVVAATTFTAQTIAGQDEAAAALLADQPLTWTPGPCAPADGGRRCDAALEVADVVGPDRHLLPDEPLAVQRRYSLGVAVWLPAGDGPWPTVIYGHGLGGDRGEGGQLARQLLGAGFAVVAIDAPTHGDHPTAEHDADLLWIMSFFGIELFSASFDVRALRDDFRLAAFDTLQLARALRDGPDVDADGSPDLDGTALHYAGHSLGGLLGPHVLALDPALGGALLSVPGARVSSIVHRGEIFAPLVSLMAPPGTTQGEIDRFFPLLQAAIDRGDPGAWAHGVRDGRRDVLMTMVLDDGIIPNACNHAMARALGVPLAGPVLQPIAGIARYVGDLPVRGNDGGRTAALWQYDTMTRDGAVQDADHSGVFTSDDHVRQAQAFFQALRDADVAEIIDPGNDPSAPR